MRHLFLALLIALLPLRGWVGDVMAAQMSTAALTQPAATMHQTQHDEMAKPVIALHADCASHAATTPDDDTGNHGEEHGSKCTTCQLCHAPALLVEAVQLPGALATVQPPVCVLSYSDALRVPGFKPPIA